MATRTSGLFVVVAFAALFASATTVRIDVSSSSTSSAETRERVLAAHPLQNTVGYRRDGAWRAHRLRAPVHTFAQKVDHTDATSSETFAQRYTLQDFSGVGPSTAAPNFLFLSGEAPMEFFEFQEVSAVDWARMWGARYVSLEHRFYGESNPRAHLSGDALRLLSPQQALEDAATFIAASPFAGPWLVFGCSYSGALSAFMRAKYPHLVVGALAPSGPVEAQFNYTGYVAQFSRSAWPSCLAPIREASRVFVDLEHAGAAGRQQLLTTFSACAQSVEPSSLDWQMFRWSVIVSLAGQDQMDNAPKWPLNATCATLEDASGGRTPLQRWAQVVRTGNGTQCDDYSYAAFVASMSNDTLPNAERSWYWQKAAQFGFFKTSLGDSVFPPADVQPLLSACNELFGITTDEIIAGVDATNTYYGGKQLHASHVLFTNGELDPWHLLSITAPTPAGVDAVTYAAGHCAPMDAPDVSDPPSVVAARKSVENFINSVLEPFKK